MSASEHRTTIRAGKRRLIAETGRWIVECSYCGPVGVPFDYIEDAEAVQEEHIKRQGFSDGRKHEGSPMA